MTYFVFAFPGAPYKYVSPDGNSAMMCGRARGMREDIEGVASTYAKAMTIAHRAILRHHSDYIVLVTDQRARTLSRWTPMSGWEEIRDRSSAA